jgi:molybdopterin/thiamine biosynthesis adenylyltransferase/nitroreductase
VSSLAPVSFQKFASLPSLVSDSWSPLLFDLQLDADRPPLQTLLDSGAVLSIHDTLEDQLGELVGFLHPGPKLTPDRRAQLVREHLAGRDLESYGSWVFYPWSGRLLHVLPKAELRAVRSDRNRYKITAEEQRKLAGARIGVLGLSVGNAAALTFALEGVGTTFKLADFDHLSLSNLNRLRAGLHEIGVAKTTIAARELFELDPYLDISVFPEGLHDDNLDAFLLEGGKLDLLVEECDDLFMKLAVRERARALRMPVVMDTSDRGMLDVERFDLEPDRPILHGLIGELDVQKLRGLPSKEKVPIVMAILDRKRMGTRMAASLPEVDETISSWPQLASGVALGGAITCDVGRRILLGQMQTSGRFYIDVEEAARDGAGLFALRAEPPAIREIAPEALHPATVPARPASNGELSPAAIRWIVTHAALAPSAHNAQPWCFVYRAGVLECRHDRRHELPTLDFEHAATWLAFGAALENLEIAARALGLAIQTHAFPNAADPDLVYSVRFAPLAHAEAEPEELALIPLRVTNRRYGERVPLERSHADALAEAAASRGATLALVEDEAGLAELGALMGACDRLSSFSEAIFHEVMPGYRFTRTEVEAHRDGLDLATMELSEPDRAGFELVSNWTIMNALGRLGGGRALESTARKAVAGACAVGLLTIPEHTPEAYLRGGRALQRLWLAATARGLALQPWTGLPYLFARLLRGGGAGLSESEQHELQTLRTRYLQLLPSAEGRAELMLFRLTHAAPPSARSLRRKLDDVLRFG